jgi:DnaJ-class molecular chaperone
MAKDYYQILGTSKTASADEIRSAYRKLARKLHPDVNKAPDAAAKFNEVQQAYDVLSDDHKRKLYDQFGSAAFEAGGPGTSAGRAGAGRASPHYSWSNVGGRTQGGPDLGGMDFDAEDIGSVFEAIFGQQQQAGGSPFTRTGRPRAKPKAPDESRHEVRISFMTAARGGVERLRVSDNGSQRTVEVTIPPGIEEGSQLRVRGGAGTGRDLILLIHIDPHPLIRRGEGADVGKGLDLYLDLPLTIAEATLGEVISVPTLGGPVDLQVPAGTASGRKLRLRGKGIHDPQGRQGDLYAVIRIVPPAGKELTEAEGAELRRISAKGPAPRAGSSWM